jgi:WXG100 family type VII secretion target
MNDLEASWRGSSADAMRNEYQDFDRQAAAMTERLNRISDLLSRVATTTEDTEATNRDLFHRS